MNNLSFGKGHYANCVVAQFSYEQTEVVRIECHVIDATGHRAKRNLGFYYQR